MIDADLLEALLEEWEASRAAGATKSAAELCPDNAELQAELARRIDRLAALDWLDQAPEVEGAADVKVTSDECGCGPEGETPPIPEVLSHRYALRRPLGAGGFGQVWEAEDLQLARTVAVKLTAVDCLEEARRAARLQHSGIVAVHDVGHDGGYCYIVFDLIAGQTLAARLSAGPVAPATAAELIAQLAEALHYSQLHGVLHRDVKPANILLDDQGRPFLADFGIAARTAEPLSEQQAAAGTLAYMAPERLVGALQPDVRSDIYSLGVVFFQLLVGQLPFDAPTVYALRERILQGPLPSPAELAPAIPAPLEKICLRCLARQPADRFDSFLALASELRDWLASKP